MQYIYKEEKSDPGYGLDYFSLSSKKGYFRGKAYPQKYSKKGYFR